MNSRTMSGVCDHCHKSTPEMYRKLDESIEDWQARSHEKLHRILTSDPKPSTGGDR